MNMNKKRMIKRITTELISGACVVFCIASCGKTGEARGTYKEDPETPVYETAEEVYQEPSADEPSADEPSSEEVSGGKTSDEAGEKDTDENESYESGDLVFNSVDIYGNPVTDEVIKGSKLVLMNLWEPWCGPCVNEMPDLESLYEKYKDDGLLILGVYSSFDYDNEAKQVVDYCGTTYPIIKADSNLIAYEQNYVPATFIFDGKGNLIDREPVEGSRSYDDWEEIISYYLSR